MSRASPTTLIDRPPRSRRTVSPMPNPSSALRELATASNGAVGSRPSVNVVGAPGPPSSYPMSTASRSFPPARTLNVPSPKGPACATPGTLATASTVAGGTTEPSRFLRACAE